MDNTTTTWVFDSNGKPIQIPKQLLPPIPFKSKTAFLLPYRNIWGNNY